MVRLNERWRIHNRSKRRGVAAGHARSYGCATPRLSLLTYVIADGADEAGGAILSIRGGGSLSAAMRRAGVFPPLLTYLAASGESAGQLDEMLERAADYLEREFDRFTATALSLLEPAIIVLMGGIVATIVLSILLPILQLNTLAGQ